MSGRNILIVDDDTDFADGLSDIMELLGHRADIANTGLSGIENAATGKYDAIIMDISLPDLSGVECLSKIRALDPGVHCFLVTGYSADALTEQGAESGAVEIMTKPVDPEELARRIDALPRRQD